MGDDGTWSREDSRSGSERTLVGLYRDVPAAEEYDLVEREIEREVRRHRDEQLAGIDADLPDDDEPFDEDDSVEDDDPLSPGQTMGMLEHLLEAEVIDEEDSTGDNSEG